MKRLMIYLKGAMVGMIAEYCFRVNFGYLQAFILTALVVGIIIDVIVTWKQ
jgi:hypothetical protein